MSLHATCTVFKPHENSPCGKPAPYMAIDWEYCDTFRVCEDCKETLGSWYELTNDKEYMHYALNKLCVLRKRA